jgi:hypothetical protein
MIVVVGTSLVNKAAISFIMAVIIALLGSFIGLLASNRSGLPEGVTGFPGNFIDNFPPAYDEVFLSLFTIHSLILPVKSRMPISLSCLASFSLL